MSDKTEKATPKRKEEARKKGQVGRSADLNGAVVLFAGLMALGATGPSIFARLKGDMAWVLQMGSEPETVSAGALGSILLHLLKDVLLCLAPVAGACLVAGVVVNLAQVGFKPSFGGVKPQPKKINPLTGAKNIFGPNALVEAGKSLTKVGVVGALVALALMPKLSTFGSLVGIEPEALGSQLASDVMSIAKRAAIAYLVIGVLDLVYQRYRHEKSLKMDKQEIKEEFKGQQLPAEVRGAMRRRQMQASRGRMMEAVPTADVVVTNPTHYAVALRYDGTRAAPEVVAKGVDLVAARIREIAREAGVTIVPDPPLARSLHAAAEVGQEIPEELFGAVAQLLAYVYKTAGRRVA